MLTWTVDDPEKRRVELWTIDVATGNHRTVWVGDNDYARIPFSPKWSPDGRLIAVTILTQRPVEIWKLKNFIGQRSVLEQYSDSPVKGNPEAAEKLSSG